MEAQECSGLADAAIYCSTTPSPVECGRECIHRWRHSCRGSRLAVLSSPGLFFWCSREPTAAAAAADLPSRYGRGFAGESRLCCLSVSGISTGTGTTRTAPLWSGRLGLSILLPCLVLLAAGSGMPQQEERRCIRAIHPIRLHAHPLPSPPPSSKVGAVAGTGITPHNPLTTLYEMLTHPSLPHE